MSAQTITPQKNQAPIWRCWACPACKTLQDIKRKRVQENDTSVIDWIALFIQHPCASAGSPALREVFQGAPEAPVIDFAEDAVVVTENALSTVTIKALALVNAQDDVAEFEKKLSDAKERVRKLEEIELPEAMAAARMTEFKLDNGKQVIVKDVVAGSPPKARFADALAWLRGHEHEGIIKRSISVTVALPKGQDKEGNKLVKYLHKLKTLQNLGIVPKDEPTIHYQTFGAWARELFTRHNEEHAATAIVDADCPFCNEETKKLLGIYVGKKAEVKEIKK